MCSVSDYASEVSRLLSKGRIRFTPRQHDVAMFIGNYREDRELSPTLQDVADALGVSKVTAHEHVNALTGKGVLVREKRKARSLMLSEEYDPKASEKRASAAESLAAWAHRNAVILNELMPHQRQELSLLVAAYRSTAGAGK